MKEVINTTERGVDLVLAEASTETLLNAIERLTHQIHSYGMREGGTPKDRQHAGTRITDLRAQRQLVRCELIRRDERLQLLEATRLQVVPA